MTEPEDRPVAETEPETETGAGDVAGSARPEIDPDALPELPPPTSRAWDRQVNPRRWYLVGCGAGAVALVVIMVLAYAGLRQKVWRTYEEMLTAVESRVIVDVGQVQRARLEHNLEAFRAHVEASPDPYATIGRFVAVSRELVADWAVDEQEVERLNRMIEDELAVAAADRQGE